MKHIIDTDELEKLFRYSNPLTGKKLIAEDDLRALIANSPQADGFKSNTPEFAEIYVGNGMFANYKTEIDLALKNCGMDDDLSDNQLISICYKAMLSAYKPQDKARE